MVTKNEAITQKLAAFAEKLDYEDLSPEAVDMAKYLCLDFAGVTLSGSTAPSSRTMVQAIERTARPGPSVIVGTSVKALPEYAALANGAAFHSVELDDVNNESSLHPGVVAYPTALALADMALVDGRSFITAVVAGYDVIVRLGRALRPAEHYGRGFHPTATCGTFGSAAISARLLGLEGPAFSYALGIAGSQAAGSMEFLEDGAWTKRFHPGWAAHSGMWAAFLAREGFIGPTTIVEGRYGFLNAYSGDPDLDSVLSDLGETYHVTRTSVKPHACCRYNQGPIDCILDLVNRYNLRAEDVEKATVGILSAGYNIVASPPEEKRNPKSVVDMQFSMPFGAAVALLYGRASLEEYSTEVVDRPEVRELMSRVSCVQDARLDAQFPKVWPAWAEIQTRDGRSLRSELQYPKGDPENALSWGEMKDKFKSLASPVVSSKRQSEIILAVEAMEDMTDIRYFAKLLAKE